jgi:hypothetical protein
MWYYIFASGELLTVGQCAPDIVLESRSRCCGFGHVDSLNFFDLHCSFRPRSGERLKEVGHSEDISGSLVLLLEMVQMVWAYMTYRECFNERRKVVLISRHDFDAAGSQCFGLFTSDISRDCADFVSCCEGRIHNGSSLDTSSADDSDDIRHFLGMGGIWE